MKLLILLILVFIPLFAEDYKLGRGLSLYSANDLELTLGGHLSIKAKNDENSIGIENAALMFYGSYTKYFSFLAEYGNENLYLYEDNKNNYEELEVHRLYGDIHLDEALNVKLGRFLTPIGIYNPTYINALRWTNIRPLVTLEFFPDIITGAQLHGQIGTDFEYSLFTQLQDKEESSISKIPVSEFSGGEVRYLFGLNSKVALNYGQYKSNTFKEVCKFGGANTLVEFDNDELSVEILYKKGEWTDLSNNMTSWNDLSWYTQYVHNLTGPHYLAARVGQKIREGNGVGSWDERNGVVGYIYRPLSALSYKAEYRHFVRTGAKAFTSDQVHLSFSVLF
ncbi:hypothetical protein [Sulfurimonas sp.]|uniref:hypothetical protein n=1 Tax=Sulfurimonas sp. TaxID=2022749 RepID=UPI0025FD4C96|nr:hypothetical protein [Sulfurimonas sp.]MBT5933839.1 hypothetical protein [Sulfurimonas sp.]